MWRWLGCARCAELPVALRHHVDVCVLWLRIKLAFRRLEVIDEIHVCDLELFGNEHRRMRTRDKLESLTERPLSALPRNVPGKPLVPLPPMAAAIDGAVWHCQERETFVLGAYARGCVPSSACLRHGKRVRRQPGRPGRSRRLHRRRGQRRFDRLCRRRYLSHEPVRFSCSCS